MTTRKKICPARIKAAGPDDGLKNGQFEAIVSVFNNIDSMGDVVMPGAFDGTLRKWGESDNSLPVIWSHRWSDPEMHVGYVLEAKEVETGLWIKGQLDTDEDDPIAKKVNRLLKGRRVTQFSFAYDVIEGAWGKREDKEVYELRELDVIEVGPTLLGANRDTELLSAKSRQDLEAIVRDVIDEVNSEVTTSEKDDQAPEGSVEDVDLQPGFSPASTLLRLDLFED